MDAVAFANMPLSRDAHRRRDAAWMAAALAAPTTRIAALNGGRPLLRDNAMVWLTAAETPRGAQTVFLGVAGDGAAVFAITLETAPPGAEFVEMRPAAAFLTAGEIAILGCGKALLDWHARHGFCANCGAPTQSTEAGWKRECAACKTEHFPRVDPVVIMLVHRGGSCLLGRQTRFLPRMVSALAGYVEPGETIDEACAREVLEEVGLRVTGVRYHACQPWPFPSSLMIGLIAEVDDEALTIDHHELEDARWFTREETRALLEGRHEQFFCPPPLAIAHHLIKAWAFS